MVKRLTNKVICAAFAIIGGFAASAEGVREDFKDDNGNIVGYKITGLGKNENETAIVFTTAGVDIPWTVPADLQNVQFLVVGGGGGGGSACADKGPGGGGGAVITGLLSKVSKDALLTINVGKGGNGGAGETLSTIATPGDNGMPSKVSINNINLVVAYGGGGGRQVTDSSSEIASGAGGWGDKNKIVHLGQPRGLYGSINSYEDKIVVTAGNSLNLGYKGGDGNMASSTMANQGGAGGGGGAIEAGKPSSSGGASGLGGNGGKGLSSDITGDLVVYGSGGGGGGAVNERTGEEKDWKYGLGGPGAGHGARSSTPRKAATAAKPNQGGGGGGGSYNASANRYGSAGGSGIVVLRYKEPNTSGFKIIVR